MKNIVSKKNNKIYSFIKLIFIFIFIEIQRYEAASTLYGPHTLAAYQQEFDNLVTGMALNETSLPGPTPPNLNYVHVIFFF